MSTKPKYYVVWRGREPGVYTSWADCRAQVEGAPGAAYKAFATRRDAEAAYAAQAEDYISWGRKKKATAGDDGCATADSKSADAEHTDTFSESHCASSDSHNAAADHGAAPAQNNSGNRADSNVPQKFEVRPQKFEVRSQNFEDGSQKFEDGPRTAVQALGAANGAPGPTDAADTSRRAADSSRQGTDTSRRAADTPRQATPPPSFTAARGPKGCPPPPPTWRTDTVLPLPPEVSAQAIAVDAACSGNPGMMEYQGIDLRTGARLFHYGPAYGTNNIGEFLAIVHALALLRQRGERLTVYSDSVNAQLWVRQRKCRTKLARTPRSEAVLSLVERAEHWLQTHTFDDIPIVKWQTARWGEIPADFGRK